MVIVEKIIPKKEIVTTDWQQESNDYRIGYKGKLILL